MKKVLILLIFIIVSISKNDNVFAQSDSIKVEYKQESIDSSDFAVRRKYKYLDIILKDEKNLIKVGIQPSILYTEMKFKITPHIIFEKKISPEWSIIFEDVVDFLIDNKFNHNYYLSDNKVFKNTINFGTRYYYGMKKAIQKKISGNNFNSNYFEFNISGPSIERYKKTYVAQFGTYNYRLIPFSGTEIKYFPSGANVSWGLQRRLNNYSFIDAKMVAGFSMDWDPSIGADPWYVGINIIFGFGHNIKRK